MTIKTQQTKTDWIVSSLIVLVTIAILVVAAPRVSLAAEVAPMSFAQATQLQQTTPSANPGRSAPGSLKDRQNQAEVKCNGKTTAECCKGISFCGCLANPMPKKGDEDKPLSCSSSPPPKPRG